MKRIWEGITNQRGRGRNKGNAIDGETDTLIDNKEETDSPTD